jgi:hypothetical protein
MGDACGPDLVNRDHAAHRSLASGSPADPTRASAQRRYGWCAATVSTVIGDRRKRSRRRTDRRRHRFATGVRISPNVDTIVHRRVDRPSRRRHRQVPRRRDRFSAVRTGAKRSAMPSLQPHERRISGQPCLPFPFAAWKIGPSGAAAYGPASLRRAPTNGEESGR